MTAIEPSPSQTSPGEDDFTDIELAEQDDFDHVRSGGSAAGGDARLDSVGAPSEVVFEQTSPAAAELLEANTIAAALRSHADNLSQLDDADLSEHVEYYQQAHGALQRALSDIDSA